MKESGLLILETLISMGFVVYFLVVVTLISIYLFRLVLIYLPDKKVMVYARDATGKVRKIKTSEYIADLLFLDKE